MYTFQQPEQDPSLSFRENTTTAHGDDFRIQSQQPPPPPPPSKGPKEMHQHHLKPTPVGSAIQTATPGIKYIQYSLAHEPKYLPQMRELITKDLSEPYSIYVYRYFLYQWAELCFMAVEDGDDDNDNNDDGEEATNEMSTAGSQTVNETRMKKRKQKNKDNDLVGVVICKLEPHISPSSQHQQQPPPPPASLPTDENNSNSDSNIPLDPSSPYNTSSSSPSYPLRGYIAMLATKTTHRSRGIAKTLVSKAIDLMIHRGADEIALETEETNTAAMKLYEGLGFLRSKKLYRYYLNGNGAFRLILFCKSHHGGQEQEYGRGWGLEREGEDKDDDDDDGGGDNNRYEKGVWDPYGLPPTLNSLKSNNTGTGGVGVGAGAGPGPERGMI